MSSHTPNITALTRDYDAIERAIRETSRGRWFLNCYLERNRSAETRLLLEAIARLEDAMRDNGHLVERLKPVETVTTVAEAIAEARGDIACSGAAEAGAAALPTGRFSFEAIPQSAMAANQEMRAAAASIETAAAALGSAGVFQGVARQIMEMSQQILRASAAQDRALGQMQRMAELVGEIEAEIMAAVEGAEAGAGEDATLHSFYDDEANASVRIPELVMAELSRALEGVVSDDLDDLDPR